MSTVIDLKTGKPVEEPPTSRAAVALKNLFRAYEGLRDAADDLAAMPVSELAALRMIDGQGRPMGAAQELWYAEVRLERELHRVRQKQAAIQNYAARKSVV